MSGVLLQATLDHLRASFTRTQVADVRSYGGEFNAREVEKLSYNCPALLVTVLGWQPRPQPARVAGRNVRGVRMACFVATKHANREQRLASAMALAELVAMHLRLWQPAALALPVQLGPLDEEPACENLYGRAIDDKGQALWLVTWEQEVKPLVPLEELYDLLAVEIIDTTQQGTAPAPAPAPGPAPAPLVVTEEINFKPLPPNP